MQSVLFPGDLQEPATPSLLLRDLGEIQDRLIAWIGTPPPRKVWDPLTHLIYSLCSSRTKDAESVATLRMLRERYDGWPTGPNSWDEVRWEKLRDAPVEEIEDTLRLVTFPERKAPQLKQTLQSITERTGGLSLQFLARSHCHRRAPPTHRHPARHRAGEGHRPAGRARLDAAGAHQLDARHHGRTPHLGEEARAADLHPARTGVPPMPIAQHLHKRSAGCAGIHRFTLSSQTGRKANDH